MLLHQFDRHYTWKIYYFFQDLAPKETHVFFKLSQMARINSNYEYIYISTFYQRIPKLQCGDHSVEYVDLHEPKIWSYQIIKTWNFLGKILFTLFIYLYIFYIYVCVCVFCNDAITNACLKDNATRKHWKLIVSRKVTRLQLNQKVTVH